jgi:hypothetical protein
MSRSTGRRVVLALVAAGGAIGAGFAFAIPSGPSRDERVSSRLPHPAPQVRPNGFRLTAENEACERCHVEIASEWRGSMHRDAWLDPVFQHAYTVEPNAFCRGCHAPESDPAGFPAAESQTIGVGCVTCHVHEGRVVGARARSGREAPGAHPVQAVAELAGVGACASCHQFDFPRTPGEPMQDTVREHADSPHANTPCQGCHMPLVQGPDGSRHRSHDFRVFGDPAMIRRAARVEARRVDSRVIEVRIDAGEVGHAFPTGDMFRRLEVRAAAVDPVGAVVAKAEPVHLARRFGDRAAEGLGGSTHRVEREDTRVPPGGARTVRLRFERDVGMLEVRWGVAYQRMSDAMAASFGVEQPRDEVMVDSGRLGPREE